MDHWNKADFALHVRIRPAQQCPDIEPIPQENTPAALKQIAREAEENPELVQTAPHTTRVQRLDETTAARKPVLRWKGPVAPEPVAVDTAAKEW